LSIFGLGVVIVPLEVSTDAGFHGFFVIYFMLTTLRTTKYYLRVRLDGSTCRIQLQDSAAGTGCRYTSSSL